MWSELHGKGIGAVKSGTAPGTVSCMRRCSPSVPFAMIEGNTRQYVALFSDITVLKEHEEKLEADGSLRRA
jgi:hypothetical protein